MTMEDNKTMEIVESTMGKVDTTGLCWVDRQFSHPERTIRIATSFSGISAPDMALKRLGLKSKIVFASDIGERYLNYNFEQLAEMVKDFTDDEKILFTKELYNGNPRKFNELTEEEVYEHLFTKNTSTMEGIELVVGCLEVLFTHYGLTERKEIEGYVSKLYDKKGRNYIKDTFCANYDIAEEDWHTDIRFMDATPYKGQVDLYVGGSPCQSYSRSGKRLCLEDTRGQLFYDFAVRIKECEPKVFIYENVAGMKSPQHKGDISGLEAALSVFTELGYHVYWSVLDAADYGVPQHRERIWVVGFKEETSFHYPSPIQLTKAMYDYLDEDILPRCGYVDDLYMRFLTGSECLRLMGFRDFKIPESVMKLKENTREDKMRQMAGNSMVVECLMALYLQMDITKYGVGTGDMSIKDTYKPLDLSYLKGAPSPYLKSEIVKIGAIKWNGKHKADSQWDRIQSTKGICSTITKSGKLMIIVSNEVRNKVIKPQWKMPVHRVPTPLW